MSDKSLPSDLLDLLRQVDTPTVANAIEVAQEKRGFDAFTRRMVQASHPEAGAIVGFARTATIKGSAPPDDSPEAVRKRRIDYYRSMADGPRPAVAVIGDEDYPDCVGAWWGEINATVHRGLGLAGVLTNGLMRDLGDLPPGFPILAGAIGPSHGFVHVTSIGTPVDVFGLQVAEGDLIHADRHGAVVVPPDVIETLDAAIAKLVASEQLILGPANAPGFNIETLLEAWSAFEDART